MLQKKKHAIIFTVFKCCLSLPDQMHTNSTCQECLSLIQYVIFIGYLMLWRTRTEQAGILHDTMGHSLLMSVCLFPQQLVCAQLSMCCCLKVYWSLNNSNVTVVAIGGWLGCLAVTLITTKTYFWASCKTKITHAKSNFDTRPSIIHRKHTVVFCYSVVNSLRYAALNLHAVNIL